MKHSYLLTIILIGTAVAAAAQDSGFEMFVNGSKSVTTHSNFDSVTLKHTATGKQFFASNYQWVISTKGTIHKGTYPADKQKLQEIKEKLKPNDIIFIEMVKADKGRLLIKGQFAFKVE